MEFVEFNKIARLSREVVVTEKIDGTNGQICIARADDLDPLVIGRIAVAALRDLRLVMFAGSRTQWITPERDNHGFARWVQQHAADLWTLGEGRHYGEWWGSGIQRGYGLPKGEKRFSLFNVGRWGDDRDMEKFPTARPVCCHVVPTLYRGSFDTQAIDNVMAFLAGEGSMAAPGFMKPEGVVVFHTKSNALFKKTLERDEQPKSLAIA